MGKDVIAPTRCPASLDDQNSVRLIALTACSSGSDGLFSSPHRFCTRPVPTEPALSPVNRHRLTQASPYFPPRRGAHIYAKPLQFPATSLYIRPVLLGPFARILRRTSNIPWDPAWHISIVVSPISG